MRGGGARARVCVCVCGRGVVEWSVGGVVGTGVVVVVGEGVVGVGVGVGGRWMGRVSGVACVVGMGGRGGGVGWWWCVWVGRWRMAVVAVGGGAASACMGWGGVGSPWPPFSLTCKQRNAACDFARECFARHLARADGDAGGNTQPGGIPKAERTRSKFAQSRAFVARVNTCGGDARGR